MIKITSLNKQYSHKPILKDINLVIPTGKIISLIGPNGAGKSTLLSLIARLEKPDHGSVEIDDIRLENYPLKQLSKTLSFLKQQQHLDLKLKVNDLIAFGRFPHNQGTLTGLDKRKINEAIRLMSLNDIREAYIDEISGGQRQRVFLAMIIAQDTKYVLLDEPLNNLDMKHAVDIMTVVTHLAKDFGKTVIMVIHDINFAANYADYIIGMKAGEIVCQDYTNAIVQEEVLTKLYGIDFRIIKDNKCLFCNYYRL